MIEVIEKVVRERFCEPCAEKPCKGVGVSECAELTSAVEAARDACAAVLETAQDLKAWQVGTFMQDTIRELRAPEPARGGPR